MISPGGVGLDVAEARDLWRGQGPLLVLPALDGSGLGRAVYTRSGWYVVSQEPPAGVAVDYGGTVQPTVLRYGD